MLAEVVDAVIGIDTHRDSHEVEFADVTGKPIAMMRISNDSAGFARLLAAAASTACSSRQRESPLQVLRAQKSSKLPCGKSS